LAEFQNFYTDTLGSEFKTNCLTKNLNVKINPSLQRYLVKYYSVGFWIPNTRQWRSGTFIVRFDFSDRCKYTAEKVREWIFNANQCLNSMKQDVRLN